ncbi:HhH-GPD-type base excision DNA repair protein [Homoserinimonas sp. OAct 916]|uniref:HhH-GPD-type base excision DNA repair protein n=1 Tax=Homoserinimonas sp. OAct 916 TaxID=2211450 RepID=UPI000DBE8E2E|nr:HhH-GPD-type base excision DNA repair protein [Homoserinimonas sp. OAct 916]
MTNDDLTNDDLTNDDLTNDDSTNTGLTNTGQTNTVHITGDADADRLLSEDPLALLIGMLLDQQVPMETAFAGPHKIKQRLGSFDAHTIADWEPEALVELFRTSPAVHRYPGSMAGRVQSLCQTLVDDWDGDADALWTQGAPDGAEVLRRLKGLPGFGEMKAKIFLALLGKQYGFAGDGWREASGGYGEEGSHRSVADIVDADSLVRVRETKRAAKAATKAAAKA